jgi:hypothetical protein
MYFIAVVRSGGGSPVNPNQPKFTVSASTPFPFSGRFKCRITGYEYRTEGDPTTTDLIHVYSRCLLNPLMPEVFKFLPDTAPVAGNGAEARQFNKSGWWEVELSGAIDLSLTTIGVGTFTGPFTFLLHLELERVTDRDLESKSYRIA